MQSRTFPSLFARTGHLCILLWDAVEISSALQDLCVGAGEAEVGLVDLLCMNQEATIPARDGGCDDTWEAAALSVLIKRIPSYPHTR